MSEDATPAAETAGGMPEGEAIVRKDQSGVNGAGCDSTTAAPAAPSAPAPRVEDATPVEVVPEAHPAKADAGEEAPAAAATATAKTATAVENVADSAARKAVNKGKEKEGMTVGDLPSAVRARMEEVLNDEEDGTMRGDSRLINFLGEVEESQV